MWSDERETGTENSIVGLLPLISRDTRMEAVWTIVMVSQATAPLSLGLLANLRDGDDSP